MVYNFIGSDNTDGHEIVVKCPNEKCKNIQKLKILYRDGPASFKRANTYKCNKCKEKIEFGLQGIVDP